MQILPSAQSRQEYLAAQIERSNRKFGYCKVSVRDVAKYQALVRHDRAVREDRSALGPILCLGTRNGREADLFRLQFFGPALARQAAILLERRRPSFHSWWPPLEAVGRPSGAQERLSARSVVGVEVNPQAARSDVWIGSFDAMPAEWTARFGLLFSNSFDQSEDPYRTAAEWRRVLRPGGYVLFCFTPAMEPTLTDRVGGLGLEDVRALFNGDLVYFAHRGSANGYSEVMVRC